MKNKNPLTYLFSKTWRYSEGNRRKIVAFWSMFIVAQSVELFIEPFVWASIMNVVQREGVTEISIRKIYLLLMLTLVSTFIFWAFHGPGRVLEQVNAFKARINYRKHLLRGVMTLPMEWHVNHHSGDTIDKIGKGVNGLGSFSEDSFMVIYSVVNLTVSFSVLVYFSPSAAYIVLTMLILSIWITMRFDRVLMRQYKELNHIENQISESIFDAISNITTVIILRVEKLVFKAIVAKTEKPIALFTKNVTISETKWFITNICATVMAITVMIVYFWQNVGTDQGILVGNVYLLNNYLREIGQVFFKFTSMYSDVIKHKSRVANSEELSEEFKAGSFTNHVLPKTWQSLGVSGLNFSYHDEGNGNPHLDDVSLSLNRGERIAFVGESGSGKTTLLKIMRDLYHPRSLRLEVDGQDIPDGFSGISRAIALVPQNPEIFATTIIENITLGADYDLEFIRNFTDMACFTEVAESLPNKFDSSIKEKGVNLSGGEQQRLALARGLLACHDKDIILLDEPTSSLDTGTETKVYRNIFQQFQDKTIISSIHRLHLLPLFQTIYVFNEGRIVASGNLGEVLDGSSEFRELWRQYHEHKNE